ncbi:hypothetical protein DVH24_004653 [Malus domestica]|uniref:Uncharacterized protein n=1 Tax=Malus domestica TaxID=3750 RepID=A0A498ICN1_MALDO|nr:hypothetical protein DVH24_004653 [Malus domestica]
MTLHTKLSELSFSTASTIPKKVARKAGELLYLHIHGDLQLWPVKRRPTDAPVRRYDYGTEVQGRKGRGRPRKTLEETLRKDLRVLESNGGHDTELSAMAF